MGLMASSCAEWKPNEMSSASWKWGHVNGHPRTVMGLKILIWMRRSQVILTAVCASERSRHEDSFLLFIGTAQLGIDYAEMMNFPAQFLHGLFQGICKWHTTHAHMNTHRCPHYSLKRILVLIWHWKAQCLIYSTSAYQEIQIWTVLIKGQVWFLPVWWMWVSKAANQTDGGINGISSSSRGFGMRESNGWANLCFCLFCMSGTIVAKGVIPDSADEFLAETCFWGMLLVITSLQKWTLLPPARTEAVQIAGSSSSSMFLFCCPRSWAVGTLRLTYTCLSLC